MFCYKEFVVQKVYCCKNKIRVLLLLQTSNHLLGPKPFPLDRLLAILYSIVDSRVAPTANIFSQVSLLIGYYLSSLFLWNSSGSIVGIVPSI